MYRTQILLICLKFMSKLKFSYWGRYASKAAVSRSWALFYFQDKSRSFILLLEDTLVIKSILSFLKL